MRAKLRISSSALIAILSACSPAGPPVEVSAADLYAAYLKNAPAADQQYRGHTLVVTGISGGIDSDGSGYVLTLVPGVRAHLGSDTGGANLFQRVTVRCRSIKFVEAALNLGGCEITSATAQEAGEGNAASSALATEPPVPTSDLSGGSGAEALDEAFKAATGHRSAFKTDEDGNQVTTRPLRILSLPFGQVLLTERRIKDGCHSCFGAIGVYYLSEQAGKMRVTHSWPNAVEGWGWGAPPTKWRVTDEFTAYPAIYAEGGYMYQGLSGTNATLTELRPSGPTTSERIDLGSSDEGQVGDEGVACVYNGEIVNIQRDKSFDVQFSGSTNETAHYVKKNGKFVLAPEPKADGAC